MRQAAGHTACLRTVRTTLVLVALLGTLFGATALAGAATTHYTYTASKVITQASGPADLLSAPTVTIPDPINKILYVLDSGKGRIVKYHLDTHAYLGVITGGATPFSNPRGMALQPGIGDDARIFVSDTGNNRLVVLLPNGTIRAAYTDTKEATRILSPKQMVWSEAAQRLYVLNVLPGGTASQVRIYRSNTNNGTPAANQLMLTGTFAGAAATSSTLSATANGINVLLDNTIVVADTGNNRILRFGLDGNYINQFGSFSAPATTKDGSLNKPRGVVRRQDGYVPVVDTDNHRIQVFLSKDGGEVIAEFGEPGVYGLDDTHLNSPEYTTSLTAGQSVISDTGNNRLVFVDVTVSQDAPLRIPTNFDNVACTHCHNQDARVEHQYRAKECLSCHELSLRTGNTDYTLLKPKISADMVLSGETEMGTCGENTLYCHAPESKADDGTPIATHAMDGNQIQQAHIPRNADGTPAETNACSGAANSCHSYGSTESPFWFADHDPSSGKLDYWYHQTRGTASDDYLTGSTDTVGTADIRGIDPPCLVCHAQTGTGVAFGEMQKRAAEAANQPWTCTTSGCHDPSGQSGYYANPQCYRTPNFATNSGRLAGYGASTAPEPLVATQEPAGVSAYFAALVDMVFEPSEPEPAPVTILADPVDLPALSTPVSDPVEFESLLCPVY